LAFKGLKGDNDKNKERGGAGEKEQRGKNNKGW
jgi:hypothetical protein